MLSDQDVSQFLLDKFGCPAIFGGHGTLQIYRGKSPRLWKDAHPGGCVRHHAVFNEYHVIPEYCFDCYKVLVTPRTVVELFKLLMIFERLALPGNNTRKCMTEGRDGCTGTYKGFIYCQSIEEGKAVRKIVREVVADGISPDVHVTLKRGCSEFAQAYPSYSPTRPGVKYMKYHKEWRAHEDRVDGNSVFTHNASNTDVPDNNAAGNMTYTPSEVFAMQYWLRYAATIGDMSYAGVVGFKVPPLPHLKRPPFSSTAPHRK